jgi:hypothetical protein
VFVLAVLVVLACNLLCEAVECCYSFSRLEYGKRTAAVTKQVFEAGHSMRTHRSSRETMGGSRLSVDVGGSKANVKRRSKELLGLSGEPDSADLKWTTEVSERTAHCLCPCRAAAIVCTAPALVARCRGAAMMCGRLSHTCLATRSLPRRAPIVVAELGGRVCRALDPLRRGTRAGEDGLLRDRPGRLGCH